MKLKYQEVKERIDTIARKILLLLQKRFKFALKTKRHKERFGLKKLLPEKKEKQIFEKKLPTKVAILGVGLIGGSIALGLKKRLKEKIIILGACNDLERGRLAKDMGIVDEVLEKNKKIEKDVEIVILATPLLTAQKILSKLKNKVTSGTLVIDVCSTKHSICQLAKTSLSDNITFIGSHPMAGRETTGFEYADPNLFRNKPWIICLPKKIKKGNFLMVKNIITVLGANPVIMDSKTHDKVAAFASHVFLVMGNILIATLKRENVWRLTAKIASTGFQDTTRLASHSLEMKKGVIATNKENILYALKAVKEEIETFSDIVKRDNEEKLISYLTRTKKLRDDWLTKYFN